MEISRMKTNLRTSLLILFFSVFFSSTSAFAGMKNTPFTELAWKNAQANNQLTLIVVHADWCPTCKAQEKILNAYFQDYPYSKIHPLIIDFDTQKDWATYFKAPRQSTLILYKGDKPIWFRVAETNKDKIYQVLKNAEGDA